MPTVRIGIQPLILEAARPLATPSIRYFSKDSSQTVDDRVKQAITVCPSKSEKSGQNTNIAQPRMDAMHQRTILIVDDEEMVIKAIERSLRNENYNIFTALGGEEGLKLLEMRDFDLVMSDQRMPGMDGVTFLQKVKAEQPHTLTIMLTGETEIQVAMQAINEAGVYKFIMKPWDDDDLKITIRRALESLDLTRERDTLRERVKSRDTLLRSLEKEHPGITQVDKDEEGYLILE